MAAMMLPGIIPLIARRGHMHLLAGAATASGYLAVWLPPAAIAFAVLTLTALNQVSQPNPWLNRIGGVAVALAGAYQFSGYKRRLSEIHCGSGQPDAANAFGAGVAHGVRCVGSSWALMSVQLVVGLMNVSWMGAISAVCVGEKTVTQRRVFSSGVGVVLIALGVVIILSPRTLTTLSAVSGRHPAA
jgi:predicted metal-binding membrane protein